MKASAALVVAVSSVLAGCMAGCIASEDDPAEGPAQDAPGGPSDCLAGLHGLDLNEATIADLQDALAQGRITSVQLVQAYLDRIAAFDRAGIAVNSVRHVNERALEEAAALDSERGAIGARGPLHGIPVLLKDNVGTNDMPTTAGSIALALNVPADDATITARLRSAGAIILGKANLSEFANWDTLQNPNGFSTLGGQVINAYTGGDPSGSSSGSGVATSLALSAGAVGSETSGSIISPSIANSVVGVKPTMGLLSRFGIIPLAENFDVPGPMTRNVADAAALLGAMAAGGPDDRDAATAESRGPPDYDYVAGLAPRHDGVRLGYEPDDSARFQQVLANLTALGFELVPIEPDDTQQVSVLEIGLVFNEFKAGLNDYLANVAGPGLPVQDLTGIILYNHAHGVTEQEQLIVSDATPGLLPLADAAALPVVLAARNRADAMFADNDVAAMVALGGDHVSLGAAAGYPTVAVPAGYSGDSPQGVTFFGPAFSEADLLSYAYAYEQATMARVPPTVLEGAFATAACGDGQRPAA